MAADLQEFVALAIVVVVATVASYRWLRARWERGASCHGCYGASECSGASTQGPVELIGIGGPSRDSAGRPQPPERPVARSA